MLNLSKLNVSHVQSIAQSYSAQDLFAALIWQRRFNEFNGEAVITDLANHSELWQSFLFTRPIYAPDNKGLSFCGMLDTLLAMANYRPMPEESLMHFVRYPADTLYILAENQDVIVAQLVDLGKKWQAAAVEVCDGHFTHQQDWPFRDYISMRLQEALWVEGTDRDRDAVLISYWWD